jgi:DnaK suppressor protein
VRAQFDPRGVLLRQRESLEGAASAPLRLAAEGEPDPADNAAAVSERELLCSLRLRVVSHRREIEAALARLEKGVFGRCVDCGEPIDPRRLRAVPWAARCLGCQSAAEKGAA